MLKEEMIVSQFHSLFTQASHCLKNKKNITLIETKVTPKNKRRRVKKNKNANEKKRCIYFENCIYVLNSENCDASNKRDEEVY